MLSTFRNQTKMLKFFLWLVIAAFIGTIFLVWGMGDSQKQTNYAIKVNDTEISYNEYQNAYEQTSQTLRQLFGNQQLPKELDLEKQVRNELINKYLLLQEATKMKIPVSDAEVLAELMKVPSFATNGQFDKTRYHEVLKANRINPSDFEANIKQDLLLRKITDITRSAVLVTPQEIKNEYLYRNTAAAITFAALEGKNFQKDVKMDAEKLKAYFDKNKDDYKVPTKIKVKYVSFDPETYADNMTVTADDIETYYINNKADFDNPESVTAQHIITQVSDWTDNASVAAAEKKIKDVLTKVKAGEDFTELAKAYSEGPSAPNGGELGTFQKGQMVKEFEDAAFALKPGETSDVIKSAFGFHIIKVNAHTPAKLLTLDEAKDIIVAKITSSQKAVAFRNHVLSMYKKILDASNISAFSAENSSLPVVETAFFSLSDNVYPLENDQKAKASLFKLESAEISNIITIGNKQYIFEVLDKKPAFIPEMAAIAEEVEKDFIASEGADLAEKKAEALIALGDIKSIAKKANVPYSTTPEFKRLEPIPVIGPNSDLNDQIFKAEAGTLLAKPFRSNGTSYIISVTEIKTPDMAGLDAEKEAIQGFLLNTKQDEAFNAFLEKLKSAATIQINPNITQ